MSFLFGGSTGETPQSIARKRQIAGALMARATGRTPQNVGEGLNAVGQALSGVIRERRANQAEERGMASAREAFSPIAAALMGGESQPVAQPSMMTGDTAQPPQAGSYETASIGSALPAALVRSESGGNFTASNDVPGSGGVGHFGRGQFSRGRLQDAERAGVIPSGVTPQQFMASPQMQQAVEQWHVGDINGFIEQNGLNRFVGQSVGGTPVTPEGMLNVAHLGGSGGLQRFLETSGRYNPSDANGTSLSDYLAMGARGGSQGRPQGAQVAQAMPPSQQAGSDLSMQEILQAAENPFLTQGQRSVLNSLMQQRMQANDPMRQMEMQRLQQELQTGAPDYMAPVDQQRLALDRDRFALEREGAGRTDDTSEYEFYARQERNAGREPVPYLDFITAQRRAGASSTNVNLPGQPEIGTIPQGFEVITDPETGARSMRAIPGGPEDTAPDSQAALAQATDSIALIDAVLNDPNLDDITGMVQGRLPPRNQAQQDLMVRVEQLQGQAFMRAFESLKGGGQITEREGQAATAAIARLNRAQSGDAYRQALQELRAIFERASTRASGSIEPPQGFEQTSSVPQGVEPSLWDVMTPEERALWQN